MERDRKKDKVGSYKLGKRLFLEIWHGMLEKAKLLIADPKCNVNWRSHGDDSTPLIEASRHNYFDIVKMLLRRQDLLIDHQSRSGQSALIWSAWNEMTKCVELLLDDPRTDVNLVNMNGCSALWFAYYFSYLPIMKFLISRGANVEGVAESVLKCQNERKFHPSSAEATKVIDNWKLCLPEFTRVAKTNKYYPAEFKDWAFNFILCCLKSRSFPKDIIYLLLEYIARAWKGI